MCRVIAPPKTEIVSFSLISAQCRLFYMIHLACIELFDDNQRKMLQRLMFPLCFVRATSERGRDGSIQLQHNSCIAS